MPRQPRGGRRAVGAEQLSRARRCRTHCAARRSSCATALPRWRGARCSPHRLAANHRTRPDSAGRSASALAVAVHPACERGQQQQHRDPAEAGLEIADPAQRVRPVRSCGPGARRAKIHQRQQAIERVGKRVCSPCPPMLPRHWPAPVHPRPSTARRTAARRQPSMPPDALAGSRDPPATRAANAPTAAASAVRAAPMTRPSRCVAANARAAVRCCRHDARAPSCAAPGSSGAMAACGAGPSGGRGPAAPTSRPGTPCPAAPHRRTGCSRSRPAPAARPRCCGRRPACRRARRRTRRRAAAHATRAGSAHRRCGRGPAPDVALSSHEASPSQSKLAPVASRSPQIRARRIDTLPAAPKPLPNRTEPCTTTRSSTSAAPRRPSATALPLKWPLAHRSPPTTRPGEAHLAHRLEIVRKPHVAADAQPIGHQCATRLCGISTSAQVQARTIDVAADACAAEPQVVVDHAAGVQRQVAGDGAGLRHQPRKVAAREGDGPRHARAVEQHRRVETATIEPQAAGDRCITQVEPAFDPCADELQPTPAQRQPATQDEGQQRSPNADLGRRPLGSAQADLGDVAGRAGLHQQPLGTTQRAEPVDGGDVRLRRGWAHGCVSRQCTCTVGSFHPERF